MEGFFYDIQLLCEFYGCNIFSSEEVEKEEEVLLYTSSKERGAQGKGYYDEEEHSFILLEGSIIASSVTPSFGSTKARDKFIQEHCKKEQGCFVLKHDVSFTSPSTPARFVLGSDVSGWYVWKDESGKRLKELYPRDKQ